MNFKKYFATIFCLLGIFTAGAYEKMSVATQAFLDNRSAFPTEGKRHAAISQVRGQEMVDVFITLHDSQNTSRITALGGVIGARFTGLVTAQVPVAKLQAIAALDEVEQVSIAEMMESDVDTTRSVTSVNYVAEGLLHGLSANYDGKGVVFGIIDSGIDFNHAAFQDSLGNTRIKCVYMPGNTSGTKVTIDGTVLPGSEFDSTRIASLTTDLTSSAHGSHTAFIGAGSHCGQYSGMAPGADIVMCALGGKKNDVNIANSLKYITQYAKRVGKPCVISISLGTKQGPHDGTSKLCKIYEEMGKSDAVICLSAGNLGSYRRYIHHKFSGMNTATNPNIGSCVTGTQAGYTANFAIDTWSRSRSAVGIKYLLIDPDDNSIFYETGIMKAYTYHYIGPGMESKRGYNAFLSQYFSGKIGVWVTTESNGHIETYSEVSLKPLNSDVKAYKMAVQFYGADGVEFDSWVTSENAYSWHPQVGEYKFVNGSDSCSMNDNVTGKNTISVGNYVGRNRYMSLSGKEVYNSIYPEGSIYVQSSYGTAPNGESYPFVAAPGYFVISAYNGYNYLAKPSTNTAYSKENPTTGRTDYWGSMSGTSMSTPTVAGIVALWLQANPQLKVDDVKEIIRKSAYVDDDVRKAPLQFGAGKINALGGFPEFQYRLTDVISNSRLDVDHYYSICDSSLTCARVSADGRTIYAKDYGQYATPDIPTEQQTDVLKGTYDQSNWVVLNLPEPLDSAQCAAYRGHQLTGVKGVIRSIANPTIDCATNPVAGEKDTTAVLNAFIPANFLGSQKVDSIDYFFVRPKPMEIDTVRCAMWCQTKREFIMPYFADEYGFKNFAGGFKPDYSKLTTTRPIIKDGDVCEMVVLTDVNASRCYPLEILSVKHSEFTLAKMLKSPTIPLGYAYPIADNTLTVMGFSDDYFTIYAKDDNQYATPDVPDSTQVDYQKGNYDQSNWVAIYMPDAIDAEKADDIRGRYIINMNAMLISKQSPEMEVYDILTFGEKNENAKMNTFLPANFLGSQKVDSVNYFLVRPKPMEIDTVRCAMWNKAADRFEMPFVAADFGVPQFEGAMAPVFVLTEGDKSDLKDGYVYDLLVQTRVNDNETFGYVSKVLGEQKPSYSLASMLSVDRMKENATYSVKADDLTVMHISPDSLTIYAKDAAKGVNATVPADGQTDYLASDKYAQHNWVAIMLPEPLDSAQMADFPGRHILGFDAELTSKAGAELKAVAVPAVGEKDTTAFVNSYIAANFYGSQAVGDKNYFFAKPAAMEIDTVRCVQWDAFLGSFSAPLKASEWKMPQFEGKFKVDLSRLEVDSVPLQDNFVYDIVTLNTLTADGLNKVYLLDVIRELGGKKPLVGDMNNDGLVDVTDTSILINGVLDKSSANLRVDRADINGDGVIDVTDVSLLIGIALGM